MLVLGDTNSCLAVIPAKRRKIPVFHMEAGNRCFDQRVPEEINRRIVDHTADINLTYSSIAREYLLREGLPPDLVIKTGSPMFEVLHALSRRASTRPTCLQRLGLDCRTSIFVVSAHREENIDSRRAASASWSRCSTRVARAITACPSIVSHASAHAKRIEASGVAVPRARAAAQAARLLTTT